MRTVAGEVRSGAGSRAKINPTGCRRLEFDRKSRVGFHNVMVAAELNKKSVFGSMHAIRPNGW
jgi:hypothetical protein